MENAFKHGVESLREDSYVHINMVAKENEIHFDVENKFDTSQHVEKPGIGLKNLKRRLELVYPKKHSLTLSVLKDVYKAQLSLIQL